MANNNNNLPNSLAAPQQPNNNLPPGAPLSEPLAMASQNNLPPSLSLTRQNANSYGNSDNDNEKNRIYDEKVAAAKGGAKRTKRTKKTRKHKGIVQTGGNKGKLRKGYKYTGKKLKNGLPQIVKCKSKKC